MPGGLIEVSAFTEGALDLISRDAPIDRMRLQRRD